MLETFNYLVILDSLFMVKTETLKSSGSSVFMKLGFSVDGVTVVS